MIERSRFAKFFYDWQTLISGLLAILAAGAAALAGYQQLAELQRQSATNAIPQVTALARELEDEEVASANCEQTANLFIAEMEVAGSINENLSRARSRTFHKEFRQIQDDALKAADRMNSDYALGQSRIEVATVAMKLGEQLSLVAELYRLNESVPIPTWNDVKSHAQQLGLACFLRRQKIAGVKSGYWLRVRQLERDAFGGN